MNNNVTKEIKAKVDSIDRYTNHKLNAEQLRFVRIALESTYWAGSVDGRLDTLKNTL